MATGILLGAGCATPSGGGAAAEDLTSIQLGTTEGEGTATNRSTLTLTNNPTSGEATVPAGLDRTWTALQAVVSELELPVTRVDDASGNLLVQGRMPRVDGKRMSHWFDCGRTMTGPVADQARITMALGFQLEPSGAELTGVSYALRATAEPRYNPGNQLACNSEGTLETFILERVAARAGG